ncbi:MAG: hypothetical protein VYC34_12375, partial [Planctomycetota bacterium]|nr:hypothetical protein [Planctomycetota bacterium]
MLRAIVQIGAASPASSPLGADLVTVAALVAGLALWLVGRRLIRPLYAVLFAAVGGLIGFILPAATGVSVNPNVTLFAGVILGGLAGLALFRISMAVALATMLGVVAPIATAFVLRIQPAALGEGQEGALAGEHLFLEDIPVREGAGPESEGFDGTVRDAMGWEATSALVERES